MPFVSNSAHPFVSNSAHRSDAMKIPTMLHDKPDYRSSAQLSSHCLEDLRLQFLAMDQKSKGGHTAMSCHSYSSRTSGSSSELLLGDEITFSPSDLQSFFSGFSSPVVVSECEFEADIFRDFFAEERSVQIAKDEASLYSTCLNEDILSAEVNPVSYRDFTKPSSFACHANAPAGIGTGIPDSFEGSELASSADCQTDRKQERAAAAAPLCDNKPCQPSSRVKLMCSFGGRIVSRPYDGKFRYVGGETRIIAVSRNIRYSELMSKLTESHGVALTLKYQIPDEDLDAFISVSSEDDLQNMMEEHDRLEAEGGSSRLRLFLFPPTEYDDHKIQHIDNVDFTNSEKQYVDAVNSISEKISSHPFESGLPSSPHVLAQQNFLNSMSIMREIDAADNGRNAVESIQSIVHQAASGQVSSLIYFPGPPSEPSSTPSSPPTSFQQPYLRQNAAVSDMSLQCFRDRLSKLSVYHHVPMDPEIFFQDFDHVYSGASPSGQRDHHITFSDFLTFAHSPGPTVCESVARGEQLHTGNFSSTSLESQCKSSSVFEQHLEYDFKQCFDYSEISSNGLGEVVSPQIEISHLVQQQQSHHQDQHAMLQKQQYKENIPAVQASQHETVSHCLAVQQPSLYVSYFHSGNSTNKGVSKQLEQHFVNQEGCLPETFARSSVSSHAIAIGGQLAYGLSSPYHKVASPKSHVKHRLQANGTFSDSSVNQPHGRKVQYGDQSSRNLQVCPKFLASADEWEVKHQQQYPTLLAAGFQELDEHSSVHQHEQYSPSWSQLSNSLTSHFLPIYNEISAPCLLEKTRTRCQTACHDSTLILNPLAARQSNCIVDYGQKASLALGRDCMNKGNLDEAGKCVEGDCNLSSICERDGFMSPMHLKVGCIPTVSHPWTDWSESFGTVPVTSYPSGSTLDAATMSQGVVTEDLQLDASPMGPRLKETTQLSRIATSRPAAVLDSERIFGESRIQPCIPLAMSEAPSRFHMMVDSPLDPMFPSSFSHLPTPRFVSGTDAVDLLNGAHKLEEISEISYAQNLQVQENHIAELMSPPEEAIGWGMGCPNDNNLDENLPGSLSMVFETFNPVQHTCEHVCPCICIHENASAFSGYLGLPASITDAVNGCSSAQLASAPYQQDSLHPSAKIDEQHEVSNLSGPPIYDRSPVSSVNALELSNSCLNPDEREAPHSDPDKDTSTTQMSLTEHLAKDMVCSVLESCEKAREQGDETMKIGEEDVRSRNELQLKDISPPPVQDGKGFTIHQEHLSRETVNVNETLEAVAEERGSSKELDQETSEHIGHNGSYEAGNKCMNRHMAEREALSRGLQIIKNADLEEIRELGSGTFGTVHHGKWKGSDVAIKRIKASCFTGPVSEQKRLILDFWKEACTLAHLHHPNVVAFYGLVPDGPDETLATVTEYMVNGSLKRVLRRKDRTIDRRKRLLLAMDIAFGMEYLHSKNIVHFDLKCENLLVNMKDPHRPICKVGDFGLSKVKQHTLVSGGVRGTLPWMAPELLSGNNNMVTEKIDVFSFGVVMWELLTGEEPYANMHCGTIIGGIVNNTLRPSVPSWCDPAWRSLMERCWSADPANRPAFSEVACELRGIAATMNLK